MNWPVFWGFLAAKFTYDFLGALYSDARSLVRRKGERRAAETKA